MPAAPETRDPTSDTRPPPDSVTLTIDRRSVTARKGTLLWEAARQAGIEIPIFCYHPKLAPVGACRMCLVQVEKLPRLQTACTTPVAQDMVVNTRSREVVEAQNGVIELLLANHPLDCPICDKGGECPLQDNAFGWGRGASRFTEEKRHKEKAYPLSERIVLDRERCIMCYRCVRFHQEITGDEALAAVERGGESEIGTLPGESYDSIFSGNTVEICPVGALTSQQYRFRARPWDLVRTGSTCNGCAVGCNVEIHGRSEDVLRLVARENPTIDDGWLCDAGRFDSTPAPREQRLAQPMVREAGGLRPASWDEAVARARQVLGQGAALLASPALSNEALWLLSDVEQAALWPAIGGRVSWPVAGAISSLAGCKSIVLVGLDAWHELPVLALWVRRAVVRNAAALVVINADNGLFRDTAHWLKSPVGSETEVAAALLAAIGGERARDAGGVAAAGIAATAKQLRGRGGPAALLVGPRLLTGPDALEEMQRLAEAIGAEGGSGLVGAPGLAANARGAQEWAPELVGADAEALASEAHALLLVGNEPWGELRTRADAGLVVAASGVWDDPRVQVALPLAHPYERQGTITNLAGQVQRQEAGALAPALARADWAIATTLLRSFGANIPGSLADVRSRMAAARPAWRSALLSSAPEAEMEPPAWEQALVEP